MSVFTVCHKKYSTQCGDDPLGFQQMLRWMHHLFSKARAIVEDHQDTKVRFEPVAGEVTTSDVLDYLSPLEIVAVLFHEASAERRVDRPINLIVFQGDSTTRELFMTLVHTIRFGLDRAALLGVGGKSFATTFGYRMFYDMVYRVFSTHDELLLFHSPTTSPHSRWTVEALLREMISLQKAHKERQESGRDNPLPDLPLLVIIWYWEPFTYRPRRVMDLRPNRPMHPECLANELKEFSGQLTLPTSACQRSLSELNMTVSVAVSGAMQWETRLGPPYLRIFGPREIRPPIIPSAFGSLYMLTSMPVDRLGGYMYDAVPIQFINRTDRRSNTCNSESCAWAKLLRTCQTVMRLHDTNRFTPLGSSSTYEPLYDSPLTKLHDFVSIRTKFVPKLEMAPPGCLLCTIGKASLLFQWVEHNAVLRTSTNASVSGFRCHETPSHGFASGALRRMNSTREPADFIWKSVAILDKGKMKHLPKFRTSDGLHCASHGTPFDEKRGWVRVAIRELLAPRFVNVSGEVTRLISGDPNVNESKIFNFCHDRECLAASRQQKVDIINRYRSMVRGNGAFDRTVHNEHLKMFCHETQSSRQLGAMLSPRKRLSRDLWLQIDQRLNSGEHTDHFERLLVANGVINASRFADEPPLSYFAFPHVCNLSQSSHQQRTWMHHCWVESIAGHAGNGTQFVTVQPTSIAKEFIEPSDVQLQDRTDQLSLQILLMDLVWKARK